MSVKVMGSNRLIPPEEAAEVLGVSVHQVMQLARQGMLRPHYPTGQRLNAPRMYWSEEVSALAEARRRGVTLPEVSVTAAQAFATARALERRVDILEQMCGAGVPPLQLDEDSVVSMWLKVHEYKDRRITDADEILNWAKVFMAIGEEYFALIEKVLGKDEPWEPFLELANKLTVNCPIELLDAEPMTRIAYGWLDAGRRSLRHAAYFYIRTKHGLPEATKRFPETGCDIHDRILSHIDFDD